MRQLENPSFSTHGSFLRSFLRPSCDPFVRIVLHHGYSCSFIRFPSLVLWFFVWQWLPASGIVAVGSLNRFSPESRLWTGNVRATMLPKTFYSCYPLSSLTVAYMRRQQPSNSMNLRLLLPYPTTIILSSFFVSFPFVFPLFFFSCFRFLFYSLFIFVQLSFSSLSLYLPILRLARLPSSVSLPLLLLLFSPLSSLLITIFHWPCRTRTSTNPLAPVHPSR